MKTFRLFLLMLLASAGGVVSTVSAQSNAPTIYFALTVHSEEPGGTPTTPDFRAVPLPTYLSWRNAILWFARECTNRGLAWGFQSDWNFLEGAKRFETTNSTDYTATVLTNTAGKNVFRYLQDNLGAELDPHSHENFGYNYTDTAALLHDALGATPSGVVGGHVYAGTNFQNWPKFITGAGLTGAVYNTYVWRPHLMMGGGTANHRDDPHVAGVWRPAGTNDYLTHSPTGAIAAVGTWEQDLFEADRLIRMLESGELPHSNKLWTVGLVINHRDMFTTNLTRIQAQLETIRRWRDAGRITVTNFEGIYAAWTNAPFNGGSSVFLRPEDNISFSLNWQDFSYPSNSVEELRTLLNVHEAQRVPVDIFLTTWQTDIIEEYAPELLGRLQSSMWVDMGYHVRAPKPYANGYGWTNVTASTLTNYETHRLDLTNGLPMTNSGGYAKLTSLMGYAPTIVGPNANPTSTVPQIVHNYFSNSGAGLVVEHRDGAINLGERRNGMYLRPESYDWKLIELFDGSNNVPQTLSESFIYAHTNSGGAAPYFVGVKLHDNDLFAGQSAWTYVYNSPARTKPHWMDRPWDPTAQAPQLSNSVRNLRRTLYTNLVAQAAANRLTANVLDARDILSLLARERPRPVGLSVTEIPETTAPGTVVARLSGGGIFSGVACDYALVNGDGDTNNSDFIINGDELIAASALDFESGSVRRIRVRWTDGGTNTGERALTLVLSNITSDDDDGDGHTEAQETVAGTDPRDAGSVLRLSVTPLPPADVVVTFSSLPGRGYQIERTADFSSWTNATPSPIIATGTSTSRAFPATNAGWFRVRVMP